MVYRVSEVVYICVFRMGSSSLNFGAITFSGSVCGEIAKKYIMYPI